MKCPKCGATENIVHFLRHQKTDDNDESNIANCWTILCKECGHNQSFLLNDLLDEVFTDWSELKETIDRLKSLYDSVQSTYGYVQSTPTEEKSPIEEIETKAQVLDEEIPAEENNY